MDLLLACGLLLLLSLQHDYLALAATQQVAIFTGQQFADEVVKWGKVGGDVTLVLSVPLISLHNATWPNVTDYPPPSSDPGSPFSSGHLTITSANTQNWSILDEGYRTGLIPYHQGTASLSVNCVIHTNKCIQQLIVPSTPPAPPQTFTSCLFTALFSGGFPQQAPSEQNTTTYLTHTDLTSTIYSLLLGPTTLKPLHDATKKRTAFLTAAHPLLHVTPFSADIGMDSSGISVHNVIVSINSPDDPMLQQLRAQQLLTPPQFCNGTLLPPVLVNGADPNEGPLWIANDTTSFMQVMTEAAKQTTLQAQFEGLPPAVLLVGNATLAAPGPEQPWHVDFPLLLSGPPSYAQQVSDGATLHLANTTGVFVLRPPMGQLAVQGLVITGLSAAASTDSGASVFPIAAVTVFNTDSSSSSSSSGSLSTNYTPIWLNNVTLMVGQADFLALAALAAATSTQSTLSSIASCLDTAAGDIAGYLATGITNLQTAWTPVEPLTEVYLSVFRGWGIDATALRVVPQTPISPGFTACQQSNPSSSGSTMLISSRAFGLVVGLICGLVLLVVLLVVGLYARSKAGFISKAVSSHTPSHSTANVLVVCQSSECSTSQNSSNQRGAFISNNSLLGRIQHRAALQSALLDAACNTGDAGPCLPNRQGTSTHCASKVDAGNTLPAAMEPLSTRIEVLDDVMGSTCAGRSDAGRVGASQSEVVKLATAWPCAAAPSIALPGVDEASTSMTSQQHAQSVEELAAQLSDDAANLVSIAGVLGQGASGTVYYGTWRELPVALKVVVLPAADILQQAVMETAIAASVGHPNVVATYHYDFKPISDTHDNQEEGHMQVDISSDVMHEVNKKDVHAACAFKLYLVQELCMASLATALDENLLHDPQMGCVKHEEALPIVADIARGLAYLHGRGIIHADLKPDNVLLKAHVGPPEVVVAKLADFGLSVHLAQDCSHVSGFARGTPFYVAPEVILTHRASPASDIYSLGVIMWEVYSGQPPYIHEAEGAHAVWNPDFCNFKPANAPPEAYRQLMLRCLQREPSQRPSAVQVHNMVLEIMQQYKKPTHEQPSSNCHDGSTQTSHLGQTTQQSQQQAEVPM